MTVVLFAGRYEVAIDLDRKDPIPLCWDRDGLPVYTRDPLVEFDLEIGAEEE